MGWGIIGFFVLCSIYVQTRGKLRHSRLTRKLTDHSNFLSPVNIWFYLFSRIKNTPYVSAENFPELNVLEKNWEVIREEALALHSATQIKASDALDDIGFNSFFKTGWKRFYLKWYNTDLRSANRLCPETVALLDSIPSVKAGMFAMLPPGGRLVTHRDPFAGSYRYHLGLQVPESDDCFINVDGERYVWKNGESVMFDETYLHYAENQSDMNRIVLFLDVRRPVTFFLVDWLNTVFSKTVMAAATTKNTDEDRVGGLNKAFGKIYQFRLLGKKIKSYNKGLYYGIQYVIYGLLIYWIIS